MTFKQPASPVNDNPDNILVSDVQVFVGSPGEPDISLVLNLKYKLLLSNEFFLMLKYIFGNLLDAIDVNFPESAFDPTLLTFTP